jgi:molybdopterin converting factor small subunit
MTTIRIPTPLRAYTGGLKEVEVEGDTVGSVLEALAYLHPSVKPHLFDDLGTLRSYVNLFVNDEDIRNLQGHETPITESDRLMIIPSIAGGSKSTRE